MPKLHATKDQNGSRNPPTLGCICCGLHIMNKKSASYVATPIEQIMNCLTHGIPALISVYGLYQLIIDAEDKPVEKVMAWVYGSSLLLLFSISTLYHTSDLLHMSRRFTPFLQKLNHAVIFVFIAASYTPWLMLTDVGETNIFGRWFVALVWCIALLGVTRFLYAKSHPQFLLMAMGWIVLLLISPIANSSVPVWAFLELLIGGMLYCAGVILLNLDGTIP
jgi:monocyte-to-macrophage differentiation protein